MTILKDNWIISALTTIAAWPINAAKGGINSFIESSRRHDDGCRQLVERMEQDKAERSGPQ